VLKMTLIEQAQDHERKAKELRKKAKEQEAQKRLETLAQFGEIIESVICRKAEETDLEKFRVYAHGIGKSHIVRAISSTAPAGAENHPTARRVAPSFVNKVSIY
jgi:hypothetical protein